VWKVCNGVNLSILICKNYLCCYNYSYTSCCSYTIELKHGPFKWMIRKTYRAFRALKDDMKHWKNEHAVTTPSPRSIRCVGTMRALFIKRYYFRKQFSFIRRQHSIKLRSTFQELDKEDDLVITRKDLRHGEVSMLSKHLIFYDFVNVYSIGPSSPNFWMQY